MRKTVLIISTYAGKTGVPILLLNTIKWFKSNSDNNFILLLRNGGELLEEYQSVVKVILWKDVLALGLKDRPVLFLIFRVIKYFFRIENEYLGKLYLGKFVRRNNIQLVYSNTATNGDILSCINKHIPTRILLYVHEGERTLDFFNAEKHVTYSLSNCNRIVTVSDAVKKTLIEKFKVTQDIAVIPGGINLNYIFKKDSRQLLTAEGIPEDSLIVMCCGWLSWQKGIDYFIQIAKSLAEEVEKIHFVWVGGLGKEDAGYKKLKFDIDKLNLSQRVSIITSKTNGIDYISSADIFLMLSREESFSLVSVEAGLAKKPVLCFENTGGPNEIVNFDTRFLVPYGDITAMCKRILFLFHNEKERIQMGEYLHKRVIENYAIEKSASSLLKVINQELS